MIVLSIQETAKETGLSPDTLRYYERIGLLTPNRDASSRHRRYNEADLASIRFLNHLRSTGMPLLEIRAYLDLHLQGDQTIPKQIAMLKTHSRLIKQQITGLQFNLKAIQQKIALHKQHVTKPAT